MSSVTSIGKCVGCNAMKRLIEGACDICLNSPNRGKRWIELARRVRQDPVFAASCYARLTTEAERQAFAKSFGGLTDQPNEQPTGTSGPLASVIPFRR